MKSRSSLVARNAASTTSRRASSSSWALTSVLTPNQRAICPDASRNGETRVRNGRSTPSAPRSGNTISNGSPVSIDDWNRAVTASTCPGSCTACQPQPSISAGDVPQYSCQRRLYHVMYPSPRAIQHSAGRWSASNRNSPSSGRCVSAGNVSLT